MKEVDIIFANLQSHEQTHFTLRPGLNFILAEDNNVGKSTIFKVISTVAKAPANSGASIDRLIRTGTQQGYAAFKYDGCRVVAWFKRGDTPGAAKLFFEYTDAEGNTTRHLACPASLLDALGIVIGENEEVINFNDADSVQLIAKNTADSDAIITHVMIDQQVERIKQNMYKFAKDLTVDDKTVSARLDTAEEMLGTLQYNSVVDEFNDCVSELEVVCRLLDSGVCEVPCDDGISADDYSVVGKAVEVLVALEPLVGGSENVALPDVDVAVFKAVQSAADFGLDIEGLASDSVSELDVGEVHWLLGVTQAVQRVVWNINKAGEEHRLLMSALRERKEIQNSIRAVATEVQCPVKGRVLYTDEECIPYSD